MAVWPVVRMRFVARALPVKPDFPRNPFPGGGGVRVRRRDGSPGRGQVSALPRGHRPGGSPVKHGSSGPGSGDHLHPSGPAAPGERLAAYLRTREGSLNTSTERALRADMQVFLKWCAERKFEARR